MNCADFESRLNDEFDSANMRQAVDLAEHAAQCAACRATWDGFRLLSECVGAWRRETPDANLADAVVFALGQPGEPLPQVSPIEARPSTESTRKWGPLSRTLTAAAAVFILASLAFVFRPARPLTQPDSQVPVAVLPEVPQGVADANEDRPREARHTKNLVATNGDSPPQAAQSRSPGPETDRVPYYDLAQRAAGALGQMAMLVLPADAAPSTAGERHPAEPPAEGPLHWMDDFERELKPVGRSLGNAFDFLWRAGESADG